MPKGPEPHSLAAVSTGDLVGREIEQAELRAALAAARNGEGGLVLVAGEAGVGKTRLVDEVLRDAGVVTLRGGAAQETTPPYGPVVQALRAYLRERPGALAECGPLLRHLALLIPELGRPPPKVDRLTTLEALRRAFEVVAGQQPVAVLLDDLQWSDETTLVEVLPFLCESLESVPVLLVGVYRSDEIPRGHPLRQLRRDLRRAGRLRELMVEPLAREATGALAAGLLGQAPGPALVTLLYERSQGIPFFVEELVAGLGAGGRLRSGKHGLTLAEGSEIPIPDTVRDAILLRLASLPDDARPFLEAVAVAGLSFDLELILDMAGDVGLAESLEWGVLVDTGPGRVAFRHALTREALYSQVPWTRRRSLHRLLAERLEERGAPSALVAEHWVGARDHERACHALVEVAGAFASVHGHRDALVAAKRAAEIWPEGQDEQGRLALLERIALCAQLCGKMEESATAWRELADCRRLADDVLGAAEALSQLAATYELQGAVARALSARRDAAGAFSRSGLPGEAAAELLAAAAHLDAAGSLRAALELIDWARAESTRAGRRDLEARALGVEGTVRSKLGEIEEGLAAARAGLELSLDENLSEVAADAYQRLANVLENAGDYGAAWDEYQAAYDYCEARGERAGAQICLVCLGAILFYTGRWDRADALDREILGSPHAPPGVRMGAKQQLGLIAAARGDPKRARRLLDESGAYAERYERQRMEVGDALGHAWIDEQEGSVESAVERCRFMLARWGESESLHYPVPALRWATTFLAVHGLEADARACAAAVGRLATDTVNPEALAAAAHAVGEIALLDGDPERASPQFERALELLAPLQLPFELAQTQARAGVALEAAGHRAAAVDRLTDAYRTARKLGARPLARRAAAELASMGEQVERRLGRRAAAQLEGPGLTRREHEVMRLVAAGNTNREIAQELFLSTRTVDMHVRNILGKLSCRSRADATRRAGELGLIA
jgi:DNA-binding NarL/FixJ family response regulator